MPNINRRLSVFREVRTETDSGDSAGNKRHSVPSVREFKTTFS